MSDLSHILAGISAVRDAPSAPLPLPNLRDFAPPSDNDRILAEEAAREARTAGCVMGMLRDAEMRVRVNATLANIEAVRRAGER